MGQYYKIIILADNGDVDSEPEVIRLAISPDNYQTGLKLTEHSYIGNPCVNLVEYLLSRQGPYYKSRIIWAGDYADSEVHYTEADGCRNLYHMAVDAKDAWLLFTSPAGFDNNAYKYVVNHSKKEYIDKAKCQTNNAGLTIHPLPLLVAEGNSRGSGDYCGHNQDMCGSWSRNIISMEREKPVGGYMELECGFMEE
jgi:hypothetical protein